jgi:non-heme chloroperoxidase
MPRITTADGTEIFYKDGGVRSGQAVVFSHGWPLSSDAWDAQLLFFGQHGFRVIAHDRRGHGRSGPTWDGNTMDQYADDLAELLNHLDIRDAVLVGHSTGGGEVARYLGRHGTSRVAKAVLLSAVPPIMLKSDANPNGTPIEVFDTIRQGVATNRAQFFKDLAAPFYGFNRPGAVASEGLRDSFWLQGIMGGIKPIYDCIAQFSETDFTADLRKIDVPVLVVHGDDDQIVPIDAAGRLSAEIIPDAQLKIYPGAPHGVAQTQPDLFNADLLSFIQAT